jgi:hypothetical protein
VSADPVGPQSNSEESTASADQSPPAPPDHPARLTARERAEVQRNEKLQEVQAQVDRGSLTIRQMTDEERRRFAPSPRQPGADRKKGRRGR